MKSNVISLPLRQLGYPTAQAWMIGHNGYFHRSEDCRPEPND
jgi:hypothetical protein